MKKLALFLAILSAGAVTFGVARRETISAEHARVAQSAKSATAKKLLELLNATLNAAVAQNTEKKMLLADASSYREVRSDLLNLLEHPKSFYQNAALWTDLRRELGIGWASSQDYVLVSKRVLPSIGFYAFSPNASGGADFLEITEPARALLAMSSDEQLRIKQTIRDLARDQLRRIELNPEPDKLSGPGGDVLARLTIPVAPPDLAQTISNRFSADMTAILGAERADKLFAEGWAEIHPRLPLLRETPLTVTIRRVVAGGEPKLIWDAERGALKSSQDIRYGRLPVPWLWLLFPGGWRELADYAHFELPPDFETRR